MTYGFQIEQTDRSFTPSQTITATPKTIPENSWVLTDTTSRFYAQVEKFLFSTTPLDKTEKSAYIEAQKQVSDALGYAQTPGVPRSYHDKTEKKILKDHFMGRLSNSGVPDVIIAAFLDEKDDTKRKILLLMRPKQSLLRSLIHICPWYKC